MWLPKDERRFLVIYGRAIQKYLEKIDSSPFKEKWYDIGDLVEIFQAKDYKKKAGELENVFQKTGKENKTDNKPNNLEQMNENVKKHLNGRASVDVANASLSARGLVTIKPHGSMKNVIGVSLTIEGYDLGRKYASWFTRTGLRFREYKDHWIWLIIAFLAGGILGPLIVEVVKRLF